MKTHPSNQPAGDPPAGDPPEGDNAPNASEVALDQLAAETPGDGVERAVAFLRAKFDPEARSLWNVMGPRDLGARVGMILADIGEGRRMLMVQGFPDGRFKLYAEVSGKTPDAVEARLNRLFPTPE